MREPLERVARALCRADGNPEDITFESKPMWQSYLEEASTVLGGLNADVIVEALVMVIAQPGLPDEARRKAEKALTIYRTGVAAKA